MQILLDRHSTYVVIFLMNFAVHPRLPRPGHVPPSSPLLPLSPSFPYASALFSSVVDSISSILKDLRTLCHRMEGVPLVYAPTTTGSASRVQLASIECDSFCHFKSLTVTLSADYALFDKDTRRWGIPRSSSPPNLALSTSSLPPHRLAYIGRPRTHL
jgi:hypothetical protein